MIYWSAVYHRRFISIFKGFSFLINENDYFFESSGLNKFSVIRMDYLAKVPVSWVFGKIGNFRGKVFEKTLPDVVRRIQKKYD